MQYWWVRCSQNVPICPEKPSFFRSFHRVTDEDDGIPLAEPPKSGLINPCKQIMNFSDGVLLGGISTSGKIQRWRVVHVCGPGFLLKKFMFVWHSGTGSLQSEYVRIKHPWLHAWVFPDPQGGPEVFNAVFKEALFGWEMYGGTSCHLSWG